MVVPHLGPGRFATSFFLSLLIFLTSPVSFANDERVITEFVKNGRTFEIKEQEGVTYSVDPQGRLVKHFEFEGENRKAVTQFEEPHHTLNEEGQLVQLFEHEGRQERAVIQRPGFKERLVTEFELDGQKFQAVLQKDGRPRISYDSSGEMVMEFVSNGRLFQTVVGKEDTGPGIQIKEFRAHGRTFQIAPQENVFYSVNENGQLVKFFMHEGRLREAVFQHEKSPGFTLNDDGRLVQNLAWDGQSRTATFEEDEPNKGRLVTNFEMDGRQAAAVLQNDGRPKISTDQYGRHYTELVFADTLFRSYINEEFNKRVPVTEIDTTRKLPRIGRRRRCGQDLRMLAEWGVAGAVLATVGVLDHQRKQKEERRKEVEDIK